MAGDYRRAYVALAVVAACVARMYCRDIKNGGHRRIHRLLALNLFEGDESQISQELAEVRAACWQEMQ
eukprot:616068-Pleurochrysis_carterae.AAC.4